MDNCWEYVSGTGRILTVCGHTRESVRDEVGSRVRIVRINICYESVV
jgi:hypothetical protein